MSYGRDEYVELLARKAERAKATTPRPTKQRAFLERADIRLSALTGDHNWDEYLSMVEAEVETAQSELATYQNALNNPFVLDDLRVRAAKMGVALCNERIRSLEWAIGLPKSIRDQIDELEKLSPITDANVSDRPTGDPAGDS